MAIIQTEQGSKREVIASTSDLEYTIGNEDVLLVDASQNHVVIDMPLAADLSGIRKTIKRVDSTSNVVGVRTTPVDGNELNSDLFDGYFPLILYRLNQFVTVESDGTSYLILSEG